MVNDTGAGHSLAGSRRTLNQAHWFLQCFSNSFLLIKVELWKSRNFYFLWNLYVKNSFLPRLSQNSMIKVAWDWSMIIEEDSETFFHSVVWSGFPNKLHFECWLILWWRLMVGKFQTYFFVTSNFNNDTFWSPFVFVCYFQLVSWE